MINLAYNYEEHLTNNKPTFFGSKSVPFGALGEERIDSEQTVPPLNTNIDYSTIPVVELSEQKGLSDMAVELPVTFNWRRGEKNKKTHKFDDKVMRKNVNILPLISTPGNQMLCGSCWAIATAGIISDNFVVSGQVDWKPNLSTSYSLTCYPQNQCKGGNPAKLMNDISRGGIVSNHCLDYSWCAENTKCNGDATKHFKLEHPGANMPHVDLNSFLPRNNCGCYKDGDFFEYKIQKVTRTSLELDKIKLFQRSIKSRLFHQGPVLGSFLVFENFMKGAFTKGKSNKGIYFENATYNGDTVTSATLNKDTYKGSHAVAIIGYGVETNVTIPGGKTVSSVPYWYCRNSWGTKWGDGGYFKMAMYGYNKLSQFGKLVEINSLNGGTVQGGGIISFTTNQAPKLVSKKQITGNFLKGKRLQDDSYYETDTKDKANVEPNDKSKDKSNDKSKDNSKNMYNKILGSSLFTIIFFMLFIIFVFVISFMSAKGLNKPVKITLGITLTLLFVINIILISRYLIILYCKSKRCGCEM